MDFYKLREAATADERMETLCEFIDFWLGTPEVSHGEPANSLAEISLPDPLSTLYRCYGQWPSTGRENIGKFCVPPFSHQDCLVRLHRIRPTDDGKIIFLHENQGVWDCRTLPEGNDPPVWCYGDQANESGEYFTGEKQVCESLSRFLVTFTLQELTLGSQLQVCDDNLDALFDNKKSEVVPLWINGPYVHGNDYSFFIWGEVLVGSICDRNFFGASSETGIQFLTRNQGPINRISLLAGMPWTLDIDDDGSAKLRFLESPVDEECKTPAGTFEFPQLMETLDEMASDEGHYKTNPMVFFHRKGQRGGVQGRHLHDHQFVTGLFKQALDNGSGRHKRLTKLFRDGWPF